MNKYQTVPMISIIVLVYNQVHYIGQTLDSILKQKTNVPIEILISDDGSTDGTTAIIREYQLRNKDTIKTFIQPINRGAMISYYDMLNRCQGKYIMNIAGDDYWLPNKIQSQYDYMETHLEVGMCYGVTKRLKGDSFISNFGNVSGTDFHRHILHNWIPALTICARNDVMKEYIKQVHPEKRGWMSEDYPMQLWFNKYSKVSFLNQEMGVYRVLDDSLSHPLNIQRQIELNNYTLEMKEFFVKDNPILRKRIRRIHDLELGDLFIEKDIAKFREYNLGGGFKGIVKVAISYLPGGIQLLRQRKRNMIF